MVIKFISMFLKNILYMLFYDIPYIIVNYFSYLNLYPMLL
jgi:hypothetical protein